MLTLRPTGLSSPAYRDWLDYTVIEDGGAIGRVYEDRHSRPELRWFWSIVVYVGCRPGLSTHGRTATLDEAKTQFLTNWRKCRTDSTPGPAGSYVADHGIVAFAYPRKNPGQAVPRW